MRPTCSKCKRRYFNTTKTSAEGSLTIGGASTLYLSSGTQMQIRPNEPLGKHCPNCRHTLPNTIPQYLDKHPSTVILFGAGASTGSDDSNTPPLGVELFDHLAKFDPIGWGAVTKKVNTLFKEDFEAGMKVLAKSADNQLPCLQKTMAEFFFQYTPSKKSLYHEFCQKIKHKNISIGFASLNYERLLELAIAESGQEFDICLPHGCCNIFCDGASTDSLGADFPGTGVTTSGRIYSVNDEAKFKYKINNDSFPPVMSYFEPEKRVTSGTNFIEDQKQKWANLCNSANEIYVIGVNPKESDCHIWEPLKQTQAKIIYCGGTSGGEIFEKWSNSANRSQKDIILKGYFQYEFENICNLIGI